MLKLRFGTLTFGQNTEQTFELMKFTQSLARILPILLTTSLVSNAALTFTATGVYDESSNTNTVDHVAGASSGDLTALTNFKNFIAQEHAAGRGGVIDFDSWTGTDDPAAFNTINVVYGVDLSSTLTISRAFANGNPNGNFTLRNDNYSTIGTPISGTYALRSNTAGHLYNFSVGLTDIAFTVLSRSGARTITSTLTYNDGSTDIISGTVIPTGSGNNDTFFSFTAPEGKSIVHLRLGDAASGYFDIDDFAFVAVPEASVFGLAILGAVPLLRRRR